MTTTTTQAPSDAIEELPELAEDERGLLPEDLTKYKIYLSLWRLSWEDMSAIRAGASAQDEAGMDILQKALKGVAVTLNNGQPRRIVKARTAPFPVLAAAMKLMNKAMEEAMSPNG